MSCAVLRWLSLSAHVIRSRTQFLFLLLLLTLQYITLTFTIYPAIIIIIDRFNFTTSKIDRAITLGQLIWTRFRRV